MRNIAQEKKKKKEYVVKSSKIYDSRTFYIYFEFHSFRLGRTCLHRFSRKSFGSFFPLEVSFIDHCRPNLFPPCIESSLSRERLYWFCDWLFIVGKISFYVLKFSAVLRSFEFSIDCMKYWCIDFSNILLTLCRIRIIVKDCQFQSWYDRVTLIILSLVSNLFWRFFMGLDSI